MRQRLTLGAIAIAIVTVVRIASTWNVFSETNDEPMHVSCGLQIYEQHQYDYQTANPPLPRLFIAAGPRMLGARLAPDMPFPGLLKTFYSAGNYPKTLIAARAGTLVFVLIALAAAWGWARREAGPLAALLTVLLLAGEPLFLGHGGLATHDAAAAAGMAVSLFAFSRWLERPAASNAMLLGAAYGFATLCKFSCIVFVPAACAAILLVRALRRRAPRPREIGAMLVIVGLASAAVVWAGYGFSFGTLMPEGFVTEVIPYPPLLSWHLPAPRFIDGIAMVRHFDREGMTSYLYGHVSTTGWWYYFPVAVALKTTLPLLALAILGLVVARRSPAAEALAAAAAIVVVTFPSTLDIGVRYVLPLYVPLAFAGAVAAAAMLERPRVWRAAAAVLDRRARRPLGARASRLRRVLQRARGPQPVTLAGRQQSGVGTGREATRHGHARAARRLPPASGHDHRRLRRPRRCRRGRASTPPIETHGWLAVGEHFYRLTKAELSEKGQRLWLDGRPYRRVGESIRLYDIPAGTAGSACRSTCGRETGDSGDRRALRLGQPALPAAPARRRPPGRFSFVGGLSAVCLAAPRRSRIPTTSPTSTPSPAAIRRATSSTATSTGDRTSSASAASSAASTSHRSRMSLMGPADYAALGFPPVHYPSPWVPSKGWIAVSDHSYRMTNAQQGGWRWLPENYRRVGKSIRLYYVP